MNFCKDKKEKKENLLSHWPIVTFSLFFAVGRILKSFNNTGKEPFHKFYILYAHDVRNPNLGQP